MRDVFESFFWCLGCKGIFPDDKYHRPVVNSDYAFKLLGNCDVVSKDSMKRGRVTR